MVHENQSTVVSLDLGIGTTAEVFQALGTEPVVMERLNSRVSTADKLHAVDLSIIPETPSGQFNGGSLGRCSVVRGGKDWLH